MIKMKEDIVAVIPVREGSQRVKNKNFRPFADEKSLLHLKIKQLQEANCFDYIYVSSDSKKAREIALENDVKFLERDPVLCKSESRWYDVTDHILTTVPDEPIVAWTMVTAPLFRNYKPAIDVFLKKRNEYNSLLTVLPCREYLLNEKGKPINCNFGFWHSYTNELDKHYAITGSLYVARKKDQLRWHYWIGTKPYLYEISKFESVDVDTEEDFAFAETLHQFLKGKK
jgi:N-acylneuraminate cytidylyltransferase